MQGRDSSRLEAVTAIVEIAGNEIHIHKIHPHPAFDRVVTLWSGCRTRQQTREHYKRAVSATSLLHGENDLEGRVVAWKTETATIAAALSRLDGVALRRIHGATAWGEQVLHRLKIHAFASWDATHRRPDCPIGEYQSRQVGISHTFWDCPAAGQLWVVFFEAWTSLGMDDLQAHAQNIFCLTLPVIPSGVWEQLNTALSETKRDAIRSHTHDILHPNWRLGVVQTLQAIWCRRSRCRDQRLDNTARRATVLLQGRMSNGYFSL